MGFTNHKIDNYYYICTIHSKSERTLNEALKSENFELIATISHKLATLQRDYLLEKHALDFIFPLLRGKTQVVSIRAPEIVIRAWEAYG